MNLEDLERVLRERLEALGPAPRAELLHVLTMPDYDRPGRIGEFYGDPRTRTFAELPIDCEEDRMLRAVLVGICERTTRATERVPHPERPNGPRRSDPLSAGVNPSVRVGGRAPSPERGPPSPR